MSTIKSSAENLTLNADGANNDIKFQSNGSEVAAIDQAGNLTVSGTVDGVDIQTLNTTAGAALPKAGGTITGLLKVYPSNGQMKLSDNQETKTAMLEASNGRLFLHSDVGNAEANSDMRFFIDNTERMKIDANGIVTKPYQPSFGVEKNDANISSGIVICNNELFDVGGNHNTSNGRFTAPVAGKYFIAFNFMTTDGSALSNVWMSLRKNNSNFKDIYYSTAARHTEIAWSAVLNLAANDYVSIFNNNIPLYTSEGKYTSFSGFLIG